MFSLVRTTKNGLMLLSGSMIRMIATFVFVMLAANRLGVENFGKYSLVLQFFELFISLASGSAVLLLTRDAAKWKRSQNRLCTSAIVVSSCLAVLAPLILIPLAIQFGYSRDTIIGIMIVSSGIIPAAISVLFESIFVARERAEFVTIGTSIECLLRFGISIALVLKGYGVIELSMVMVLSRTLLAVVYFFILRNVFDVRWAFHFKSTVRFAKRWRVFTIENWMATTYKELDVIFLSWFAGEYAVGLYRAAMTYIRLGAVVARSFTNALFPIMSRLYGEAQQVYHSIFCNTIRIMSMVALPAIALTVVIPDRVIGIIFKPEYADAAPVLQVLVWTLLFDFLNPFLSYTLYSQGKGRYSMYVAAIALISNIVLMSLWVSQYGSVGAAVGTVMCAAIATSSYLSYIGQPKMLTGLIIEVLRIAIAAAVVAAAVYLVADQSWITIGLVAGVVYVAMLVVVQAVRMNDLRSLRQQIGRQALTT